MNVLEPRSTAMGVSSCWFAVGAGRLGRVIRVGRLASFGSG
jgi:hypothetical protein